MWRIIVILALLSLSACAEIEDPAKNKNNRDDQTNNQKPDPAPQMKADQVEIKNLQLNVITKDTRRGCDAVDGVADYCPIYEIIFSLQNNDQDLAIDRLTLLSVDFGDGRKLTTNIVCDQKPWSVESGDNSGVVDVIFSYGGDGYPGKPYLSYECGEGTGDTRYKFEKLTFKDTKLPGEVPITGEFTLSLEGLMQDASPWRVSASATF